jgi:hypothetical protein
LEGYAPEVVATAAVAVCKVQTSSSQGLTLLSGQITQVLDYYIEPDHQVKYRTSQVWRERYSALHSDILALLERYRKEDAKVWMAFSQKVHQSGSAVLEQSRFTDGFLSVSDWGTLN